MLDSSSPLVITSEQNPVTTSLIIAAGTEVHHRAVIQLVRKYQDDLEEFGSLAFQMRVMREDGRGGEPTQFALLNEPQAALIMTYMKNTPIVRDFKKRLVRAFFEMRDVLREGTAHPIAIRNTPENPVQTKVSVNTSDLVREANKGNRFAQRLLHHLTGMQVDDIAAEIEHKMIVEEYRRAELVVTYLAALLTLEEVPFGVDRGTTSTGQAFIQAETTSLFNAFKIIGKQRGLPLIAKDIMSLGVILGQEKEGMEFNGWRRTLGKHSRGRRFYRYEQIVEVQA